LSYVTSTVQSKSWKCLDIWEDDDELNGVHCAWGCDLVDIKNEDDEFLVHMINDKAGNFGFEDKAILIS